ncbi:MAG: hypothetical protein FWE94_03350 [Coriobacteriia bacterium]|nr:hypothetical protein [Coriobacteriia bacterium]
MKKYLLMGLLAVMVAAALPTNAFAASNEGYTITVPRVGAQYSANKTVTARKDFGTRLRYSGGKTVNFQICDTQKNGIGPTVCIKPGGAAAPLIDIWYNSSASSKAVKVKLWTSATTIVQVLAQGTWYWNY